MRAVAMCLFVVIAPLTGVCHQMCISKKQSFGKTGNLLNYLTEVGLLRLWLSMFREIMSIRWVCERDEQSYYFATLRF